MVYDHTRDIFEKHIPEVVVKPTRVVWKGFLYTAIGFSALAAFLTFKK